MSNPAVGRFRLEENMGMKVVALLVIVLVVFGFAARSLRRAKGDIGQDLPDSDDDEDEPVVVVPPEVGPPAPKQVVLSGGDMALNVRQLRTPEQLDKLARERAQKRAAEAIAKAEAEDPKMPIEQRVSELKQQTLSPTDLPVDKRPPSKT